MRVLIWVTTLAGLAISAQIGLSLPAAAAVCGSEGQRPCKIWEHIPSCQKGLVESFTKGKCLRKARPGIDCGRQNQRACKIWERIPSCNPGLVEVLGKGICVTSNPGVICGRENQRPCTITERVPSCNPGLVENFIHNKCVATAHTPKYRLADQKMRQLSDAIAGKISFAQRVATNPRIKEALNTDQDALGQIVDTSAVGSTQMPDGKLLRTLTIGASAGAKFIIGGSAGTGAAIDLGGRRPAYIYGTADYSASLGIGASAGMDIGFWVCQNNKIGGDSWGIQFSPVELVQAAKTFKEIKEAFKPGLDVGITLWFDYDNIFQGFTITPNIGAGVDFGGFVKAGTLVHDDPAVNCDGTAKDRVVPKADFGGHQTFIQNYQVAGGLVRHTKVDGGTNNNAITRVCLGNQTSRAKGLDYNVGRIKPLKVGAKSGFVCADFPSNQRLNFDWVDNGRVVKKDGMSLRHYAGDTVIFDWEKH